MTDSNLPASPESPDQCEIPAPAISQSSDIVQRARQALDARDRPLTNDGHGHVRPRLDGARMRCGGPRLCKVCQAELTVTPNPWDLARELVALVEVALPSALAQRDDALAAIERLRERVGIEVRDREQWESNADELCAAVERVRAVAEGWANPTIKIDGQSPPIRPEYAASVIRRALDGEV